MANITANKSRDLFLPGALQGFNIFPSQAAESFYAMLGVTVDSSGNVGPSLPPNVWLASPTKTFSFTPGAIRLPRRLVTTFPLSIVLSSWFPSPGPLMTI